MNRQRLRRVVQVGVVGGLVAIPVMGLLEVGGPTGTLCSVGWGPVSMSCPAGVTQTLLAARSVDWGLLLSALPLVVLALFLGRVFCSWVCPQGLLSELNDGLRRRLRKRWGMRPDSLARAIWGRRVLLAVLGIGLLSSLVFGVPVLCYICPIGLICRGIVQGTGLGPVGGELAVVGLILVAELFVARRGWCKYICPVGALYGLLKTRHTMSVVRDPVSCVGCGSCERDCPMGCSPLRERVGPTCTNCAVCVDVCPEEALGLKLPDRARRLQE